MKIEFEISDKSFEILKDIGKKGAAEFRDYKYDSFEEFKLFDEFKEGESGIGTEKWFKNRNFCDKKDIEELIKYNLVDGGNEMDWHVTYYVSDFGKQILEKYK